MNPCNLLRRCLSPKMGYKVHVLKLALFKVLQDISDLSCVHNKGPNIELSYIIYDNSILGPLL